MLQQPDDAVVDRLAIATADLLRHDLNPDFAEDDASVIFLAGPPLDRGRIDHWTLEAKQTRMDIIYLGFEPGRERLGPERISIFSERHDIVFRWLDCALWAPDKNGPLLLMSKGVNVCFAHDGKALLSFASRPAGSTPAGTIRARARLRRVAASISWNRLDDVASRWRQAA